MTRLRIAFALGSAFFVLPLSPAAGKERVRARLDAPLAVAAAPGETITIAWTLTEQGERRPFGAGGVFVRLFSASGEEATKSRATEVAPGRYTAAIKVPQGGVGGIEIGLEGTRYIGGRAEDADLSFPLDNDPFAAPAVRAARSPAPWLATAAVLAAVALLLAISGRRLRRGSAGNGIPSRPPEGV
jgi:hypothetical protein